MELVDVFPKDHSPSLLANVLGLLNAVYAASGPLLVYYCEDDQEGLLSLQKWEEHVRAERGNSVQSSTAAQLAWQRWAAVPRKARTVLKQADPEGVAILELSYLQFMEDVSPTALLLCV